MLLPRWPHAGGITIDYIWFFIVLGEWTVKTAEKNVSITWFRLVSCPRSW